MFFHDIIHGTQYYRSPTPLPEEWDSDIANFEKFGLDAFQIRINWRWNEKRENEYDFSDIDRLLELAKKHRRKVIMKFLLECAPQYIFDKYEGTRIGPRGETLRGGAHGAFYGGWRPCFTNPMVLKRAEMFVEKVAQRYADREEIILWNAWNEIRNKPIEDCFCKYCRSAFGNHLKGKFGTVEALNRFYGSAEDSFETIALPAMPHGYWDIYEYKKFKSGPDLYHWLEVVKGAIRKYDAKRPVMTHVGVCSAFQSALGDLSDDFTVSRAVDFWGTSIPCACNMDTEDNRLDFRMLHAFLHAVDENYFIHEIYPGLGMFKLTYDTPFDMKYKINASLAAGVRGIVYWQYRAERVGHENDCAGIMRMDGSPRPVAYVISEFAKDLHRNMSYFSEAKVPQAEIGIVFDYDSALMSIIEDSCGSDFQFELSNPVFYYRFAHAGFFRLIKKTDREVGYVGIHETEKFRNFKVLYVPYCAMLTEGAAVALKDFAENGGVVICDEGFAMRQPNTWMNPYTLKCADMMQAQMLERRRSAGENVILNGQEFSALPYRTQYAVENAECIANYDDGTPAVFKVKIGKGAAYLCGFSVGYSYYKTSSGVLTELTETMMEDAHVGKNRYSDFTAGLEATWLENRDNEIVFLTNASEVERRISLSSDVLAVGGAGPKMDGEWLLPPHEIGYAVLRKQG